MSYHNLCNLYSTLLVAEGFPFRSKRGIAAQGPRLPSIVHELLERKPPGRDKHCYSYVIAFFQPEDFCTMEICFQLPVATTQWMLTNC